MNVGGNTARGFEGVVGTFAANFAERGDEGAAFCAYVDGRPVVDLWGGDSYRPDALHLIFSATKGITALCLHLLVQRGLLDLEEPVSRWWPEFAQGGKEKVPVRWLLSHQVGLPTIDRRLTRDEAWAWDPVCDALAAQSPYWDPGSAYGYHGLTFGWLVGEVLRRVDGRTVGRFFAEEVAGPLDLEAWIGLPPALNERVAPFSVGLDLAELGGDSLLVRSATLNGALGPLRTWVNDPSTFAQELPAGNGIADARSLARLYAAVIGPLDGVPGTPLLSPETLAAASTRLTDGVDQVFASVGLPVEIGIASGFWVPSPVFPWGGPRSFGHPGASGALGFADPDAGVACGYVTSTTATGAIPDPRSVALVEAVYSALQTSTCG